MFKILVEISARHVHLSPKHLEKLFGPGYQLNKLKDLSQKGQFAAKETVILKTLKSEIPNVRIVGPVRKKTQVEISKTDAIKLGINPPIRKSGDLAGSAGCVLIGPKGKVKLKEGVIIAWRHLHLNPRLVQKYGLTSRKYVSVKVKTQKRSLTFHQVYLQIDPSFTPSFQIDTDEANAAGIEGETEGIVMIE